MKGRRLFALTLGLAGLLVAVVALAPLAGDDAPRVVALFGQDVAVRRVALVAALGLAVTAFVFFAPPPEPPG